MIILRAGCSKRGQKSTICSVNNQRGSPSVVLFFHVRKCSSCHKEGPTKVHSVYQVCGVRVRACVCVCVRVCACVCVCVCVCACVYGKMVN